MSDTFTNLSFAEALQQLNETLEKLETGDISLNEAIDLYEHGMALSKYCQSQLDGAELRVKRLNEDGTLDNLSE